MMKAYPMPFVTDVHLINYTPTTLKGTSTCGDSVSMDMPDTIQAGATVDFKMSGTANLYTATHYDCKVTLVRATLRPIRHDSQTRHPCAAEWPV